MHIIAVIPAYNEASTIKDVLLLVRSLVNEVVVVNDGSNDETAKIAKECGVIVVSHAINRGLGAALGTGFEAALKLSADIIVTLDADGQHDPKEISRLVEGIKNGADMVIGSRMIDNSGMPWYRKIAQVLGNLATLFLFGAWVSDSQSGFRAFSKSGLQKIEINTNRMEVSSELVAEAKRHKLIIKEVPITAIYTDYSLSKGQNWLVGLKTLLKLIIRRLSL